MIVRARITAGVLAALVLTGCGGAAKESRQDAALDVNDLWAAIATYYVDHTDAPEVTFEDGHYIVAGVVIEARLNEPDLKFATNGWDDWCVTIHYNNGADAVSDGSNWELKDVADCQ